MSENRTRFRLDQRRAPIYEALEQFRQIAEYCLQNKLPLRFVPVPKDELDRMLHFFPGSTAQADRDTFDYLYRSEDLKFFRGKNSAVSAITSTASTRPTGPGPSALSCLRTCP